MSSFSSEDMLKRSLIGSILGFRFKSPKFHHEQGSSLSARRQSSAPFNHDSPCSSKTALEYDAQCKQLAYGLTQQQQHTQQYYEKEQQQQYQHGQQSLHYHQQQQRDYQHYYNQGQQHYYREQQYRIQQLREQQAYTQQHQTHPKQQLLSYPTTQQQQIYYKQQQQQEVGIDYYANYSSPTEKISLSDQLSESLFLVSPNASVVHTPQFSSSNSPISGHNSQPMSNVSSSLYHAKSAVNSPGFQPNLAIDSTNLPPIIVDQTTMCSQSALATIDSNFHSIPSSNHQLTASMNSTASFQPIDADSHNFHTADTASHFKNSTSLPTFSQPFADSPQDIYQQIVHECEPFLEEKQEEQFDDVEKLLNEILEAEGDAFENFDLNSQLSGTEPYLSNFCETSDDYSLSDARELASQTHDDFNLATVAQAHQQIVDNKLSDGVLERYDTNEQMCAESDSTPPNNGDFYSNSAHAASIADMRNFLLQKNVEEFIDAIASYVLMKLNNETSPKHLMTTAATTCPLAADGLRETLIKKPKFSTRHPMLMRLPKKSAANGHASLEELIKAMITTVKRALAERQRTTTTTATVVAATALSATADVTTTTARTVEVSITTNTTVEATPTKAIVTVAPIATPDEKAAIVVDAEYKKPQTMAGKTLECTSGATSVQILRRKRQQNNEAAARYRERQRNARQTNNNEIHCLIKRNTELHENISVVQREIDALRKQFIVVNTPQATEPLSNAESRPKAKASREKKRKGK